MNPDDLDLFDQAESSVISEIVYNPASVREAVGHVMGSDFTDVRLGALFNLVVGMVTAGGPGGGPANVTPATVRSEAKKRRAEALADRTERNPWLALPDDTTLVGLLSFGGTRSIAADAKVIREAAESRALVKFGHNVIQAAQSGRDIANLAALVAEEAKRIRDGWRTTGLPFRTLGDVLADESLGDYDWIVPGLLERGDRLVITGGEGLGKALALDTPIPTPKGWTTMGALKPGDEVFSADGTPVQILGATDVMTDRPCYRVEFSDGTYLIADEQHQWLTETLRARESAAKAARRPDGVQPRGTDQRWKRTHFPSVVTTGHIRDTLWARDGHALNHSVEACAPLQYPVADLPVHPYVLGAWLGDGASASSTFTCADKGIIDQIAQHEPVRRLTNSGPYTWSISDGVKGSRLSLKTRLRSLGILGDKHIPASYLTASVEQRLELLRGLMDTDGCVTASPNTHVCEFTSTKERLAEDVLALCRSLGIKATSSKGVATLRGVEIGPKWRISFTTTLRAFHLSRKAERQVVPTTRRSRLRYITRVVPIASVPVRCIQVANPDGLFVAGEGCIVTHNSTFLRQIALCAAAGIQPFTAGTYKPSRVLVIDAENSYRQWHRKARGVVLAIEKLTGVNPAEHVHLACVGRQDVTHARDLGNIHAAIDEYEPDLLMIGPLYKLLPGAINNDTDTAPLITALDGIRERGVTLIMEAHAGKGEGAGGERNWAPRGSAALMGWPEFGLGLAPDAEDRNIAHVRRWRGDRDERDWPQRLRRGGVMPWTNDASDPPPSDSPQWTPSGALGRVA